MVELRHVTKILKGKKVLDDICCTFTEGQAYGLMGINGSGKTMLMRAICGLITPTSGEVVINGKALGKELSFPESLGALIENPAFIDFYTGFENLQLIAKIKKVVSASQINDTLQKVGLEPGDKRKYKKYSLGMKQRLGIAAAIMELPDIVIFDEPLNALDEEGVKCFRNIIAELKEHGSIIILACHDRDELLFLSDHIHKIDQGRISTQENGGII